MRIAVLGAGAWGTALAIDSAGALTQPIKSLLWARDPQHLPSLFPTRQQALLSPLFPYPIPLRLTSTLDAAVESAELAPDRRSHLGLRETLRGIATCGKQVPLIWGCEGFEARSAKLPHQVAEEEYAGIAPGAVLSGPVSRRSLAQEHSRPP